ncbi:MAG: NAD(P)/FAD-dependent oxidoreductase [Gammaproteobacteria bacterium]|nr:NAD(P)/FAD-dependent oxidoreductase [Gammaproteobacteria bacterium]
MKSSDRNLGMARSISRRDLLLGVGASAAAAFVPGRSFADEMLKLEAAGSPNYPPGLTGLRGSHPGSFEVAHQLGREGRRDWGSVNEPDADIYDLVVVGCGVSGLAAAHFYRRANPDARILILDNHDDFGGHAKRNEFQVAGRTLLTHGGSEILEGPDDYSDFTKGLFHDLGIQPKRLGDGFDVDFYKKNGLTAGIHFDRETFGVDRTLAYPLVDSLHYQGWIPIADASMSHEDAVRQMPISDAARHELLRLLTSCENVIPDLQGIDEDGYLNSISYREFLSRHLEIEEPEVYTIFENLTSDWCVGIEAVPAIEAFYWGLPGIKSTSRGDDKERMARWYGSGSEDAPTYHFPDGNASVARMLVRNMIPDVAPGNTIEDVVDAVFDYSILDRADNDIRIRLRSTAVNVQHDGSPRSSKRVGVTYVCGGQASRVWARQCVLACYNQLIPSLCPELPEAQGDALKTMVKSPILYSNVALRNWQPWKKLGVGALLNPGSYHVVSHLDYPVDFGAHRYPKNPDEPAVVHMVRFPHRSSAGLTPSEQKRAGRHELYATSYETIERNIRRQLAGSLSEGGFDPARDIEGITVNRWAHAYINRANPLYDEMHSDHNDERYPFVRGRKPFGRIAIANSDSGSSSLLDVAIDQAHRAVSELA